MIEFILNRPITLTMAVVLTFVLGLASFFDIRRQINPDGFEPRFMYVEIYDFNLSPEETDRTISEPLSGLLRTVKDIKSISSRSYENRVSINLDFQPSANMRTAYLELQTVIDRAKEFLPPDARSFIWRWNPDASPIIWAGFQPPKDMPTDVAKEQFETRFKPQLQRIDGVATVEVFGLQTETATVRLNPALLSQYQVTPDEIVDQVQQHNVIASVGSVQETPVVVVNRVSTLDELANIEIRSGLKLKDLGTVKLEPRPIDELIRIDGKEFFWMSITKQDGANVLEVSQSIMKRLADLQVDNKQFGFEIVWNEGDEVESALNTIIETSLFSGLIAMLVVFFFLRNMALTLLVSSSIPLSIFITLMWLYFTGQTLNILSMMGIMLACGMVVDNAIVVAEAIFSRLALQESRRTAILGGVKDVGLPVVMGTLTSVAVFLPLIMMNGNSNFSFFMKKIGVPVCIALLGSLAVALVVIPYLINQLPLRQTVPQQGRVWSRIVACYRGLLDRCLNHRFEVLGILIVLGGLIVWAEGTFVSEAQDEDNSRLHFRVEFDDAIPFFARTEYMTEVESYLSNNRDRFDIKQVRMEISRNNCCARLRISRLIEQKLTNQEMRTILQADLPERAGVRYNIREIEDDPRSLQKQYLALRIRGTRTDSLAQITDNIKSSLLRIAGVVEVKTDAEDPTSRNVDIIPDRNRGFSSGTAAAMIAAKVRSYLGVATPFELDERYPIEIRSQRSVQHLEDLRTLEMVDGVRLGHIADVAYAPKLLTPQRHDGALSQQINIFFDESLPADERQTVEAQVMGLVNSLELPPGFVLERESFVAENDEDQDMMFALVIAILLVFLIMGVLFESTALPFVVLFTIPLAFMGTMAMSVITGMAPGVMGSLGMVILVGVVVNNGIVLVDLMIKNVKGTAAADYNSAIADACCQRLRPVVMTAGTTILGLFPMAFGSSNILGIPFSPLAHAIIGGLFGSTLITLFLIPVVYSLVDDLKAFARATVSRKIRICTKTSQTLHQDVTSEAVS